MKMPKWYTSTLHNVPHTSWQEIVEEIFIPFLWACLMVYIAAWTAFEVAVMLP